MIVLKFMPLFPLIIIKCRRSAGISSWIIIIIDLHAFTIQQGYASRRRAASRHAGVNIEGFRRVRITTSAMVSL